MYIYIYIYIYIYTRGTLLSLVLLFTYTPLLGLERTDGVNADGAFSDVSWLGSVRFYVCICIGIYIYIYIYTYFDK